MIIWKSCPGMGKKKRKQFLKGKDGIGKDKAFGKLSVNTKCQITISTENEK